MGEFGNAKILGGVGAILMLVGGFVPTGILSIVGLILVFLAIKQISDTFNDQPIFKNFLFFVILNIVATVALVGIIFVSIGGLSYYSTFTSGEVTDISAIFEDLAGTLAICLLGWIIFWILNVIGSLYLRKSFNSIAQHTKVDLFKTTGFVYFIGAILLIIGIGAFVILIADILMIIAFFKLPDDLSQTGTSQQSGRVCPNCGRPIPMDAQVCPYCGKNFKQ